MSITLNTTMSSIMTNKRRVGALKSLGVVTVGDALTYYPFRVAEPVPLRALREARIGERMAFSASVRGMRVVPMNVRPGYRLEAVVDDGDFAVSRHIAGAAARLVFFSYKKRCRLAQHAAARRRVCGDRRRAERVQRPTAVHPSRNLNDGPSGGGSGPAMVRLRRSTDPYAVQRV